MRIEELTVEEVAKRWAGALAVFNRHSIDICCGGAKQVREAAALHGVPLDTLLSDLAEAGVPVSEPVTR